MKKIIFVHVLLISIFLRFGLFGQENQKIDSLRKLYKQTNEDTAHYNILLKTAQVFANIENYDSALAYASNAAFLAAEMNDRIKEAKAFIVSADIHAEFNSYEQSLEYRQEALKIFIETGRPKDIADTYLHLGITYQYMSNFDIAIEKLEKAVEIYSEINDKKSIASCISTIGIIQFYKDNYSKSLENFNESLRISLELGDSSHIAESYNTIGIVYHNYGDYTNALSHYQKAMKIKEALHDSAGISMCCGNIGIVYDVLGDYMKALEYFKKSLAIDSASGNERGISRSYNNIGLLYNNTGDFNKALEFFEKSLSIKEKVGDIRGTALVYTNIADAYKKSGKLSDALDYYNIAAEIADNIGDKGTVAENSFKAGILCFELHKLTDAERYALKGYTLANEINHLEHKKKSAEILSKIYDRKGNHKKAYDYLLIFKNLSDSLVNKEKIKEITAKEYQYKYEKELEIKNLEQQKKDELHASELAHQASIRNWIILGLVLSLMLIIFIFRNYKIKQKANIELKEKNEFILWQKKVIEEANEELNQTNEELNTTLELVNKQKEDIELAHEHIKDSILYAGRIQMAILPENDRIRELFPEHFIIFQPRDVVSGDFYWVKDTGTHIITATADCTGHGVPGAFMSILGHAFLKEITDEHKIIVPNLILEKMRDMIKSSLKQTGKDSENKDGMDIALFSIEKNTNMLNYAGANNPLLIIRSKQGEPFEYLSENCENIENEEYILTEIKADRQPVSIFLLEKPFTNHVVQLEKNDIIYSFSDGYADQFGGKYGRKYMLKNFKEFLLQICSKPMQTQKELLENELSEWMSGNDQIDDILVTGIKII